MEPLLTKRRATARAWTPQQCQILLTAYQSERAADVTTLGTMTALFATCVATLGLIGSAFAFAGRGGLSGWVTPFIPLVPLPLIAWGAACVNVTIARGRLIDVYEDELKYVADMDLGGIPIPGGATMLGGWWQGPDGNVAMATGLTTLLVMYISIIAASAYESFGTNPVLGFLPSLVYCVVLYFLVRLYLRAFDAQISVERLAQRAFGRTIAIGDRPTKQPKTTLYRLINRITVPEQPRKDGDSRSEEPRTDPAPAEGG